jgi:glycolate oxidase FAD binding subunit
VDLSTLERLPAVRDAFAGDGPIVPTGARTHWEVGGPAPAGTAVVAPRGVVSYDPADLTITVGAGTSLHELDGALAEERQHCPLDARDTSATVGGLLACGLSGARRLRYGPLRDQVLEVRFVTGDARVVKGGGPTVKNVTGYDLPRLLVGSFGTLGFVVQVTLRCRPRPTCSRWGVAEREPADVLGAVFRPSTVFWDGTRTAVLVEGDPGDVDAQLHAAALDACEDGPSPVAGEHRGRIAVAPGAIVALGRALARVGGLRWLAEAGIGTVHVAAGGAAGLDAARAVAHEHGGWMLREAGGRADDDGFGVPLPNPTLHRRLRDAFDPGRRLNPGRLPLP